METDMALDQNAAATTAPRKDLYALGEMPPLGHVPARMHAWVLRRERHGEPEQALLVEEVDVPKPDSHEVLVMVMAAMTTRVTTMTMAMLTLTTMMTSYI